MLKIKTHFLESERCQNILGHRLLCESLPAEYLWQGESFRFVPKDSHIRNNTININFLVLHVSHGSHLYVSHIIFFNWSLQNTHRILFASLSSNFFPHGEKGNSSSLTWLIFCLGSTDVLKQVDFFSKMLSNKFKARGYYMLNFQIFSVNSYLFIILMKLSARKSSTYIFKDTLRNDTQVFLVFKNPFILLLECHQLQLVLSITWLHQFQLFVRNAKEYTA